MLPLCKQRRPERTKPAQCGNQRSYCREVPEVRLEPMSDEEYAEFRERSEVSYAAAIAASRAVSLPEARRQAAEDHEQLLPEGVCTPGPLPVDGLRGRPARR